MAKKRVGETTLRLLFCGIILLGLVARIYFVPLGRRGDIKDYAEWGAKFWEYGPRNFYFDDSKLFTTAPNYPPLGTLVFAGSYWLYDHRYFLAQLHNLIKIPPAFFIVYFYEQGYYLLLKLPSILADLGVGVIIYKVVRDLTKSRVKGLVGMGAYALNPVSVFLSGVWGQTDGLVAFWGLLAFILLAKNKIFYSLIAFWVGIFLKPSWMVLAPLFLFTLIVKRPAWWRVASGMAVSAGIFFLSLYPFASGRVIDFTRRFLTEKFSFAAAGAARASNSAFNFNTIFQQIDRDPPNIIGPAIFAMIYLGTFWFLVKRKASMTAMVASIFMVGLGGFLFYQSMLERYFFPAFAGMMILLVTERNILGRMILINLTLFANMIWSFYRRGSDELDHLFTNYNFFLIRALSAVNVIGYLSVIKYLSGRGRVRNS